MKARGRFNGVVVGLAAGVWVLGATVAGAQPRMEYVVGPLTNHVTVMWVNEEGWQREYYVKPTATAGGSVVYAASGDDFYRAGTNLTVTAVAEAYYRFSHWSGQVTGTNNPLVLWVEQPYTNVVAHFVPGQTALGTPIAWYWQQGITNGYDAHDQQDMDGDGRTGREEYLWGTHPLVGTSYPRLGVGWSGSGVWLWIPESQTGRVYTIRRRVLLGGGSWEEWTNGVGTGGGLAFPLSGTNGMEFYRGEARVQ